MIEYASLFFIFIMPHILYGLGVVTGLYSCGRGGWSTYGLYFLVQTILFAGYTLCTYMCSVKEDKEQKEKGEGCIQSTRTTKNENVVGYDDTCLVFASATGVFPVFIVLVYHLIPLAFK